MHHVHAYRMRHRSGGLGRRFRHMVRGGASRPRGGMTLFMVLIISTLIWSISAATHQRPVQQAEMIEWQSVADPGPSSPGSAAATP